MKIVKNIKNMIVLQLIFLILGVLLLVGIKTGWIYKISGCQIKEQFGFFCPTCGATRCMISFMNLQFQESFQYHPTFFILICYVGIADLIYIINTIRNKKILKFLYPSNFLLCIWLSMYVLQYILRLSEII